DELESAVRTNAVRDALLNEAMRELEVAQGGNGLFTGQRVGDFELGDVIARGGMGEVYRAYHAETREVVAVKLLHRKDFGDPKVLARFVREANTAASLQSPHITRVLALSTPQDPIPFIAMELLDGEDLRAYLRHRNRMAVEEVVEMIDQLAIGLDVAHAHQIVHRDIKPTNVFRTGSTTAPVWKILDFGISRQLSSEGTLTEGAIVGTPGYMPPEQAAGRDVDRRADVYGLAVVAYRSLTGHPPFAGDATAVLIATIDEMPIRPGALCELRSAMEMVLAIGLAKDRAERFSDAPSFARALRGAAAGQLDPSLRSRARAILKRRPWKDPESR
ncbi:MAG: serine/threonine-protein kinase, partial [Myxococcota bacterium]